ncbi:uncharacterized protein LOC128626572 [Artibeus jamaicensis]|uniref:uncharacterized protein LOC128626572 n=1 Tax=Artibeus jamaicensis TaxID=9417 RepID=UPI00235AB4BC|nr:uncharacterized protein LOC128626572 [Artibeus jamaicensis]XP_053515490.1 uncharacterized protein LOC128626572 [Artibeus jamaicensis]
MNGVTGTFLSGGTKLKEEGTSVTRASHPDSRSLGTRTELCRNSALSPFHRSQPRLLTHASPAAAFKRLCGGAVAVTSVLSCGAQNSHLCGSFRKRFAHPCSEGEADQRFLDVCKSFVHSDISLSHKHSPSPHFFHQVGQGERPDGPPALVAVSPGPRAEVGTRSVIRQLRASLLRWPVAAAGQEEARGRTSGPPASVPVSSPSGLRQRPTGSHPTHTPDSSSHTVNSAANTHFLSPKVAFPVVPPPTPVPAVTTVEAPEEGGGPSRLGVPPGLFFAGSPWTGRWFSRLSHRERAGQVAPGTQPGTWVQSSPSAPRGWQAGPSSIFHDRKAAQGEVLCDGLWETPLGTEMSGSHCCLALCPIPQTVFYQRVEGPAGPAGVTDRRSRQTPATWGGWSWPR